jgi:hypothetical protein
VKKSLSIFAIGLPAGSVLAGDNGGGTHSNLTIHSDGSRQPTRTVINESRLDNFK